MAKFLNKKEQVIDLKLTSYGHYLFSIGDFNIEYYAFFDDNILYDGTYGGISESQSEILDRIQNKTSYLESLVLFEDLQDRITNSKGSAINYYDLDVTPTKERPRISTFRYGSAMGDAYLDGATQDVAPAWKIVNLNGGTISTVTEKLPTVELPIPQLNIDLNYRLTPSTRTPPRLSANSVRQVIAQTGRFFDRKTIALEVDTFLTYVEEVNTDILTHNFDVEVFEVLTGAIDLNGNVLTSNDLLRRYFVSEIPQIVDGLMVTSTPQKQSGFPVLSSSVEYYFNFLSDQNVDKELACRSLDVYNKQSYYIDLDFDCTQTDDESIYYDIYGSEVEPEICLD